MREEIESITKHGWNIILLLRAYTTPYIMLILLVGFYIVNTNITLISHLILVFFCYLLYQFDFLLLNDFIHAKTDEKMGRKREIYEFFRLYRFIVLGSFILLFFLLIVIALVVSVLGSLLIIIQMIVSILYAKAKRIPLVSQLVRGLIALIPAIFFPIVQNSLNISIVYFCLFMFFLDAAGNLVGDIRDYPLDQKAENITTVVHYSRNTVIIILWGGIFAAALFFSLFTITISIPAMVLGLMILLVTAILSITIAMQKSHFVYLCSKYLLLLLLLTILTNNVLLVIFLASLIAPIVFFVYRGKHFRSDSDFQSQKYSYLQFQSINKTTYF